MRAVNATAARWVETENYCESRSTLKALLVHGLWEMVRPTELQPKDEVGSNPFKCVDKGTSPMELQGTRPRGGGGWRRERRTESKGQKKEAGPKSRERSHMKKGVAEQYPRE